MDRRANVKWIYAIGVVLIITNAASGVSGDIPGNSSHRSLNTDNRLSTKYGTGSKCCSTMNQFCGCECENIVKTSNYEYDHVFPIRKGADGRISLRFYVKGDHDANLIFTEKAFTGWSEPCHEIILSASSGYDFSRLRRAKGSPSGEILTWSDDSLVKPWWREFWVVIDGRTVTVRRPGGNAFLVSTNAPDIPINYYSVAGFRNAHLLWSLPCVTEKDL